MLKINKKPLEEDRSYLVSEADRTIRRNSHHMRQRKEVVTDSDLNDDGEFETTVIGHRDPPVQHRTEEPTEIGSTPSRNSTTRSGRIVRNTQRPDFEYY